MIARSAVVLALVLGLGACAGGLSSVGPKYSATAAAATIAGLISSVRPVGLDPSRGASGSSSGTPKEGSIPLIQGVFDAAGGGLEVDGTIAPCAPDRRLSPETPDILGQTIQPRSWREKMVMNCAWSEPMSSHEPMVSRVPVE